MFLKRALIHKAYLNGYSPARFLCHLAARLKGVPLQIPAAQYFLAAC